MYVAITDKQRIKLQYRSSASESAVEKICSEVPSYYKKHKGFEMKTKVQFVPTSCRICLNDGDIQIYGEENQCHIPTAIFMLTTVEIQEDDEYPKYLCHACNEQLQSALLFKQIAQETDALLREAGNIYAPEEETSENDEEHKNIYTREEEASVSDEEHKKKRLQTLNFKRSGFKETLEDEHTTFHCSKCDLVFSNSKAYAKHMFTKEHKNASDTCPFCCRQFKCIVTHLAIHKKTKTHQCDICGQKFLKPSYTRHRKSHFDNLPFKCQECPYEARFSADFKIHMRKHTGEKPYKCNKCSCRFTSKSNLNRHSFTHKEYSFACNVCNKGFVTQSKLVEHMTLHTGKKAHHCIICNKNFVYRRALMRHTLKVHKREKLRIGRTPNYLKSNIITDKDCIEEFLVI
ncbi:unnamed protein product [Chilo suppressalis]|uniref:Uncharacterized protein n=1 Tax=Chilo suppressalis TaxID=168631 RepID=A0ABN8B5S7_CHISP|nr:unnamed protein product [Chilo suppressalis]